MNALGLALKSSTEDVLFWDITCTCVKAFNEKGEFPARLGRQNSVSDRRSILKWVKKSSGFAFDSSRSEDGR